VCARRHGRRCPSEARGDTVSSAEAYPHVGRVHARVKESVRHAMPHVVEHTEHASAPWMSWTAVLLLATAAPLGCDDEGDPAGTDGSASTESETEPGDSSSTSGTSSTSTTGSGSGPSTVPSCSVAGQSCEENDCCEGLSCQPEGCVEIPPGCAGLEQDCSTSDCCPGYVCDSGPMTCVEP
jgi:hypothetical protein